MNYFIFVHKLCFYKNVSVFFKFHNNIVIKAAYLVTFTPPHHTTPYPTSPRLTPPHHTTPYPTTPHHATPQHATPPRHADKECGCSGSGGSSGPHHRILQVPRRPGCGARGEEGCEGEVKRGMWGLWKLKKK